MHEYSFASRLVEEVLSAFGPYAETHTRVTTVSVAVGRLHQVVEDNLLMAYALLTRETPAAESKLILRFVDIAYSCLECGQEGILSPPFFLCARCSSGRIDITGGREFSLERMEID